MAITDHLNERKYVAFLDVLGFKELVVKKGKELDKYFETIGKALQDINSDKYEITSQLISDSTILACNLTNFDFRLLLKAIQTIQSRCALENIWIRGAITIGDIYFDKKLNIVVGNGLSDAYLMESQEKFPRVIIDPKIIIETFNNRSEFINFYNKIEGDEIYPGPLVNPNYPSPISLIDNDAFFVSFAERIAYEDEGNLEIVYNHIKRELYSGQKNYNKYFWLKNYFTEALRFYFIKLHSQPLNQDKKKLIMLFSGKFRSL